MLFPLIYYPSPEKVQMATNRSSAKNQEIRSKRKWKTITCPKPQGFSNKHESECEDGTKKHITCFSCGHQGHFSSQCRQKGPLLISVPGSSNGTQAEILVSNDQSLTLNSYDQDVENRYLQDRMYGIITCMVCGKEGHYTCECSMKDQEDKVFCTLCSKEGHCYLWCCQQNKSQYRACTRCGEIGHSASNHGLSCSSCDEYHPRGECRMSKVTCFICEGQDHYLSQCPLNSVLTTVFQQQRDNFRAALRLALSKEGSTLVTPAKPSKESEVHGPNTAKQSAGKRRTASAKCFSCGKEGHFSNGCPSKPQILTRSKSNPLVTIDSTPRRVIICFKCGGEGHYSYGCPSKPQVLTPSKANPLVTTPRQVIICFDCGEEGHFASSCPSKLQVLTPNKSNPLVTTDSTPRRVIICFNCGEEGHFASGCPSKPQVLTPRKSNPLVTPDNTPRQVIICFNCGEEGHYHSRCHHKRQKSQDYRTKSSR